MLNTATHSLSTNGRRIGEAGRQPIGRLFALAVGALLLAAPKTALAQDTFGLGNGRSGPLRVSAGQSYVPNGFLTLARNVLPGDTLLQVSNGNNGISIADGTLILLIQMWGISPSSGDGRPIEFTNQTVGFWEFARVTSSRSGVLTLSAAVRGNYSASRSQLVVVPEYTGVTIEPAGTLTALPWDGFVGGILAFLSQGVVRNDGDIVVTGLGFRGGPFTFASTVVQGCGDRDFDLAAPQGGAKGEALGNRLADLRTGRGNFGNAGGGGNCYGSGGGGGGNFGEGGKGGFSSKPVFDVGGLGGSAVSFLARQRLFLGGGGGSGQGAYSASVDPVMRGGTDGAPGGGIVLFRAAALAGNGVLSANGSKANDAGGQCGAGGGGAGGTVYVRLVGAAECRSVRANGGSGGNNATMRMAPGGGGGGGVVFAQASDVSGCHFEALGGSAGTQPDIADGTHGATPASSVGFDTPYTGHLELFQDPFDPRGGLPREDAGVVIANLPLDGGSLCQGDCDALRRYRVGWGCNAGGASSALAIVALIAGALLSRRSRAR